MKIKKISSSFKTLAINYLHLLHFYYLHLLRLCVFLKKTPYNKQIFHFSLFTFHSSLITIHS